MEYIYFILFIHESLLKQPSYISNYTNKHCRIFGHNIIYIVHTSSSNIIFKGKKGNEKGT